METRVEIEGKAVAVEITNAARRALANRQTPLLAEIELAQGHGEAVPDLLAKPPGDDAPLALRQRYHELRAAAYRQTGNIIESARELVRRDALLESPSERIANQVRQ